MGLGEEEGLDQGEFGDGDEVVVFEDGLVGGEVEFFEDFDFEEGGGWGGGEGEGLCQFFVYLLQVDGVEVCGYFWVYGLGYFEWLYLGCW